MTQLTEEYHQRNDRANPVEGHREERLNEMTDEEWKITLAVLSKNKKWEEIWRLVQMSPAVWSMRLLLRLKQATWMPEQATEREAFTQLLRLAEECHQEEDDTPPVYCQATLREHSKGIKCLAISPDGRMLAGGRSNGTVRLWRLTNGKVLTTLTGHTKDVTCVAISPDGRMLVSGSEDNAIRLWRLPEGTPLKTPEDYRDFYGSRGVAFSANGRLLASAGSEFCEDIAPWEPLAYRYMYNTVCISHLPHGAIHRIVRLDGGALHGNDTFKENTCVTFNPGLRMLACGKRNGTVRLWRWTDGAASHMWRNGEAIYSRKGHTDEVTCVAINPDKRLLASGSKDTTVRLWSLANGGVLHTLKGHTDPVSCVAISPDGWIVASGSWDKTVRLWRLPNGKALQTLKGHTRDVTCVAINPDGRVLASGSSDGTVRLWTLWKFRLRHLCSEPTRLEHLLLVENILKEENVTDADRKWLEFLLALMHWQWRILG